MSRAEAKMPRTAPASSLGRLRGDGAFRDGLGGVLDVFLSLMDEDLDAVLFFRSRPLCWVRIGPLRGAPLPICIIC